jgi:hypothetical protein
MLPTANGALEEGTCPEKLGPLFFETKPILE